MNFVLIDYKGGAAFRAFRTLPHTAGMLSDLDEFLVERALVSLRAELQRRKAILDRADKTNIQRYWDALPEPAAAATRCRAWSSWWTSSRSCQSSCRSSWRP